MSSNRGSGSNRGSWYTRGGVTYGPGGKKIFKKKNPTPNQPKPPEKQTPIDTVFEPETGPYKGWNLYFTDEKFKPDFGTHLKLKAFEKYIERNKELYSYDKIEETKSFPVDLKSLLKDEFTTEWTTFENDLNTQAEHTLNCLGLAMHQKVLNYLEQLESDENEQYPIILPVISVRLLNHSPIIQLKNLKVNYYGKLASVRGTVIRVSNVKLICHWMEFKCLSCEVKQTLKQPEGVFTLPTKCLNKGCRSLKFEPILSSVKTVTDNWQLLKLQESDASKQNEGGRIPRTIECEVTGDLVNCSTPGDDITVTGIIRVRSKDENSKGKQACMFLLFMDVVSVVNNKNQTTTSNVAVEFSLTDYYAIQKIHAEPLLFKLLVHSLCPLIYGHEVVKAGLLLALMGGTNKNTNTRNDIHVLMVGDPGLGKSQMLQTCCNVAARSVFVCGNTSTSAGLTVTITRESGSEYALEAGALTLADQGCCCIDELDKMTANHAALLEAMEQQTISIAKAGVVCSLPARTSILAAANPVGGHYNKAKTVSENLKLSPALLSRFDLVFILLDKPDEHLDSLLTEHVLALHTGKKHKKENANSSFYSSLDDQNQSLRQKLQLCAGEDLDLIPHQLLRKFIVYAKKYVHPTLTKEATEVLKSFYMELRRQYFPETCTPVTTRQLQSLIRLTQARAKCELREEATEKDAMDVVDVMKFSLVHTYNDNFVDLDLNNSMGSSGSNKTKMKQFLNILMRVFERESRNLFTFNELKDLAVKSNIKDFNNVLDMLNMQGHLLKKGNNTFQLLT